MLRLKLILQYKYLYILLIIIAIITSIIRVNNSKSVYSLELNNICGILIDKKIDGDIFSGIIKNKEKVKFSYKLKTVKEKNYVNNYLLGINLCMKGNISIPTKNTIPNTFNYQSYLLSNNIHLIFNAEKIIINNNHINIFYKVKNRIINYLNTYKNKNYMLSFIIGDKTLLDEDIKNNFQEIGVSHIFAISGMHISIMSAILLFILKKFKYKYYVVIIFLIFFLFLTNYSVSVLRSILLFILLFINKQYDFDIENANICLLTISALLILFPYLIINIGFIYSSLVSFTLIKYSHLIKGNYITKILLTSLLAFIVCLPITINNNYEFNLLTIISNLIYVPLISLIIYPLCLLSLIIKPLEIILGIFIIVLEFITKNMITINIIMPKIPIFIIILYYIILYIYLNTLNGKCLLIILTLLTLNKYKCFFDNNIYVYFLNVNQGDSILIHYKNNNYLIDTGGNIQYKVDDWKQKNKEYKISNTYMSFFKSVGITSVNIILSHGDYDHMGEAINLVNNFKVENVIFNCGEYNDLEKELIKVLDKKKIKYYSCIKELNIDKSKLEFLNTKEYDNENDNSNVIYFNYNNYKFLFMGDAGVEKEKDILEKYSLNNIDFLKVGHHGSNTSSSNNFINSINPKYSLISVGKNNRYGHPKDEVLDTLKNSKIYRTDLDGSIMFKIKNNKLQIETCAP